MASSSCAQIHEESDLGSREGERQERLNPLTKMPISDNNQLWDLAFP